MRNASSFDTSSAEEKRGARAGSVDIYIYAGHSSSMFSAAMRACVLRAGMTKLDMSRAMMAEAPPSRTAMLASTRFEGAQFGMHES